MFSAKRCVTVTLTGPYLPTAHGKIPNLSCANALSNQISTSTSTSTAYHRERVRLVRVDLVKRLRTEGSPVRRGGVEGGEEGGEGGSGPGCTAGGLRTRSRETSSRPLEALLLVLLYIHGPIHTASCCYVSLTFVHV